MGNSVGGIRLLSNGDCPYHVQLGNSASIDLKNGRVEKAAEGRLAESWEASYTVDGSTSKLVLRRIGNWMRITLADRICTKGCVHQDIETAETGLLKAYAPYFVGSFCEENTKKIKTSKTINAWGGVTETSICLYGSGNKGGLFVVESKKRSSRDEHAYMVTVAHYFAYIRGNVFNRTDVDIGLSVVAKVRPSDDDDDDRLAFTVEGPVQHPAAALFYLFDEVFTTGFWKPNACPHCDNNSIHQRRRNMLWQSDGEDSDNNLPAARPHGRRQNEGGGLLGNNGVINGNKNGNLFVDKFIYRGR